MDRPWRTVRIVASVTLALVVGGVFAGAESGGDPGAEVLARWQGGQLDREGFLARYDPAGEALAVGGERLDSVLRQAVYREIYGRVAEEDGLAEDPEMVAFMDQWSTGALASLYRDRGEEAAVGEISEEQARAYYEEHKESRFTFAGVVDLGVVFVRCAEDEDARAGCRGHMTALQERVLVAEEPGKPALEPVILEERERSGAANGFFRSVLVSQLAPSVGRAVLDTPVGSYTPVVETPIGLFWMWIESRREPNVTSFESARSLIDSAIRDQRKLAWREAEATRLRTEMGEKAAGLDDDGVFAAAARAAAMDKDPTFLERQLGALEQRLPLLALERDAAISASDEELRKMLADNPARARSFRRFWVVVAVAEPQEKPYAAHRVAEEIGRRLGASPSPADALRGLDRELEHVAVYELGPLSFGELRVVNQRVGDAVAELADGAWAGPMVLESPFSVRIIVGDPGDLPQLEKGLGFVVLERSEMPPLDEIRDRLQSEYRRMLLQDGELFEEVFAERWMLELFPEPEEGDGALH